MLTKENLSLDQVLVEIDSLMSSVLSFMIEFQASARTKLEARGLPPGLARTVEWFAEDMDKLRRCLPSDLRPGFASRVKFVFQKGKIEDIVERLEQRKSSVTLALSAIGR